MANGSNGRGGGSRYVEKFYGVPGHIYVARNDAHRDGIYKIGLTTRVNPETRINELNKQAHEARVTGHIGHLKLVCSYETIDCGRAESTIHEKLASYRYSHNREFFELRLEAIQSAIKSVLGDIDRTVRVTGKSPQQLEHEEKHRQQAARQLQWTQEQKRKEKEDGQRKSEQDIRRTYNEILQKQFPPKPFWQYWLGGAVLVFVVQAMFGSENLGVAVFLGLIAGGFLQAFFDGKTEKSPAYKAIVAQRDQEITDVWSK